MFYNEKANKMIADYMNYAIIIYLGSSDIWGYIELFNMAYNNYPVKAHIPLKSIKQRH